MAKPIPFNGYPSRAAYFRAQQAAKRKSGWRVKNPVINAIKRRMWFGETIHSIAADSGFGLSQLCDIRCGLQFHKVPWPDGTLKGMPEWRKREIALTRVLAKKRIGELVEKLLREMDKKRWQEKQARKLRANESENA
jgi:hypothetical protein